MKINKYILDIVKTDTLTQSSITTVSTVLNGVLGILFYIFLARFLGPSFFGVFAVTVVFLTFIGDISNLGTDTGLIRFVSKYLNIDKKISLRFLKLGLEVKVATALLVIIIGWILMPLVAKDLFLKEGLAEPFRLALFGVATALFFSFVTHALQAYQKFWVWSFINIASNGIRLILIFIFAYVAILNINIALITYILIPLLGFLVGLLFLPNFIKVTNEKSVAKEFFHYNKWVALFVLIAALSSRVDTFIIARFFPNSEIGIYAAANQMAGVVPQIIFALATVVAPKLASFTNNKQAEVYLKKLQFLVLGFSFLGILFIPLVIYVIPILFGVVYIQSINIFIILFVAQLVFLVSLPAHQAIFYYFSKPKFFVTTSIIQLLVIIILSAFFLPIFGIIGIAFAVLGGNIINFLIPAIWVVTQLKKDK